MNRTGKTAGPGLPDGKTLVTSFAQLTKRQQEVARLIAKGKFNAEIAAELDCAIKTIDTHRAAILGRLGLRNNVELVLFLIKAGEVDVGF